jgi:hypothetical protein
LAVTQHLNLAESLALTRHRPCNSTLLKQPIA